MTCPTVRTAYHVSQDCTMIRLKIACPCGMLLTPPTSRAMSCQGCRDSLFAPLLISAYNNDHRHSFVKERVYQKKDRGWASAWNVVVFDTFSPSHSNYIWLPPPYLFGIPHSFGTETSHSGYPRIPHAHDRQLSTFGHCRHERISVFPRNGPFPSPFQH